MVVFDGVSICRSTVRMRSIEAWAFVSLAILNTSEVIHNIFIMIV